MSDEESCGIAVKEGKVSGARRKAVEGCAAVALALLFSACAPGYREALRAYREAEPTAFHQETLAWTARHVGDATHAPMPPPQISLARELPAPNEVFIAVVAAVLGEATPTLAVELEALAEGEALERSLAEELDWRTLALATALRSPAVRAAGERWTAMLHQFSQADYLETLVAQYRAFTRYLEIPTGWPAHQEMLQGFLPYPGTLALKGEMIQQEVRMAELEWQAALRDALLAAGEAYYEYQYLARADGITRENIQLLEHLLRVVEEQIRAGGSGQADLLRVQTERERQRNLLLDLGARRRSAVAELNGLLDRPADAALGRPSDADRADVQLAEERLLAVALEGRQELGMARARLARGQAAIRMGEVMNRPPASQGYSALERGMMSEAAPARTERGHGEGAGGALRPFGLSAKTTDRPDYARAEAFLAEMRARLRAETWALAAEEASTRARVRAWREELDVARRGVALLYEVVLPQSRSAYETSLSGYTAGRVSFIDLQDAERAWLEARLELAEMRRRLNLALLSLARTTGSFGNPE